VVEVVPGELPVEGLGNGIVTLPEGGEPFGDRHEVEEVLGGDHFPLHH
jgi:hypothetical protein